MFSFSVLIPKLAGDCRHRMLMAVVAATVLTSCTPQFKVAPVPAVTFVTIKGEKITAAELRGKVVLVNFWATDCPVCIKEMPMLIETHKKYQPRGLEIVAVAMKYDPPNLVVAYTEKNALPFKVALDPMGEHAKAFGDVRVTPTTFIIDKRGNVFGRIVGEPDFRKLHELIEKRLAEAG